MKSIINNQKGMQFFLQIIHSYGQLLQSREVLKSLDFDIPLKNLSSQLYFNKIDIYSYEYRETGYASGLTDSNIQDIQVSAKEDIDNIKKQLISKLVSSEKHYKKLKHQFRESFPELNDDMLVMLKSHIDMIENKKREKHALFNSLISLSTRFISFIHYSFGGGFGLHIAYRSFSLFIINKYNIDFDKKLFDKIINKYDFDYQPKLDINRAKLTPDEINFLASILKQFIENVTQDDLDSVEKYTVAGKNKPENKLVSEKIVKDEFDRFKKLYNDYKNIINKIKNS